MSIHLDQTVTQNFAEAIGREWLETNGIGGWAGSTISNVHTRRYHGLLVAATRPPVGRMVLLSKLDETLVREDLFTPGVFTISLKTGDQLGIIVSTDNPIGRDAVNVVAEEKARRKNIFSTLPVTDELTRALTLAADQFVVRRGDDQKTIIAGYHWFTDWGRDSMIA